MGTTTPAEDRAPAEGRVVFAFFMQPLVVGLLAFALFPVIDLTGRSLHGGRPVDAMDAAIAVGLGAALASVFVIVFAAMPLYAWLRKRGGVTLRQTLAGGAVLGNVPAMAIVVLSIVARLLSGQPGGSTPHPVSYGFPGLLRAVLLGAAIGTGSAAVFWLMTGRQAPRLDHTFRDRQP